MIRMSQLPFLLIRMQVCTIRFLNVNLLLLFALMRRI